MYSGSRFPRSGPVSQQAVCESYKRLRILDELAAADGRIGLDIGREAASEISFFFGAAVTTFSFLEPAKSASRNQLGLLSRSGADRSPRIGGADDTSLAVACAHARDTVVAAGLCFSIEVGPLPNFRQHIDIEPNSGIGGVPIGVVRDLTIWLYSCAISVCCLSSRWVPGSVLKHSWAGSVRSSSSLGAPASWLYTPKFNDVCSARITVEWPRCVQGYGPTAPNEPYG